MPAEIKIIERAEMYLRKLSCGVNPLTCSSYRGIFTRNGCLPTGTY